MPSGLLSKRSGIIGESEPIRAVGDMLARFARCDIPVLIHGETGTGKELFARAAHYNSDRGDGPLIPVNCGALPDSLLESELFGHRRGAFTDAKSNQAGMVALAEKGTLFLDEVDALSPRAQVAVLRFLQDRQYWPIGADKPMTADVRIIAATNADLDGLVEKGRFRQDLKFRIDVATLRVPPLRERGADILLLARHFLERFARRYGKSVPRLGAGALAAMRGYRWPGNVRELENVMHRAVILLDGGEIEILPLGGHEQALPLAPQADEYHGTLKDARARCLERFEHGYLSWLLATSSGNITAAARLAHTERRHLGRMIRRAGLTVEGFKT